jgi:hypothetical protein
MNQKLTPEQAKALSRDQIKQGFDQTIQELMLLTGLDKLTVLSEMKRLLDKQNSNKELEEQPTYPGWPKGWTKEEIEAEDKEIAQALKAMNEKMAKGDFSD